MTDIPHDLDAEQALLGIMLMSTDGIRAASEQVTASDFYRPAHGLIFDALTFLYYSGESTAPQSVAAELRKRDQVDNVGGLATLSTLINAGPTPSSIGRFIRLVCESSLRRNLIRVGLGLQESAKDASIDADIVLETAKAQLSEIDVFLGGHEPDDVTFEEFVTKVDKEPVPWLVKGLIKRGWRTIIVAPEGAGKTVLVRQIAVACSHGLHPFERDQKRQSVMIEAVPTLLLDLENPEDNVADGLARLLKTVKWANPSADHHGRLWHRQGGIDLRTRRDRLEVESLIRLRRPAIICAGPLYKMMGPLKPQESWEFAAREIQCVLDDWRARYNVAIVLEDHAPKSPPGQKRKMAPYGSSLWLRWPEIGFGMVPDADGNLTVERYRGDRVHTNWPSRLLRASEGSNDWPWIAHWAEEARI